ncbi:hypothetical protein OKW40_003739 [Paraburkholderia sp. RAU6.4a]
MAFREHKQQAFGHRYRDAHGKNFSRPSSSARRDRKPMYSFMPGSTSMQSRVHIDMLFIAMHLREQAGTERAIRTNRWLSARRPVGRPPAAWLACYPVFQDALLGCETRLGALPDFVRRAALERLGGSNYSCVPTSVLDEVRASYLELRSTCVAEEVRRYLSDTEDSLLASHESSDALETLAAGMPRMLVPPVARPPCLLSSGNGMFLGGWARFVAYWCRKDPTIPLLAVDWPILYEHVAPYSLRHLIDDPGFASTG